jgi:hypothetical protein
MRGDRCCFAQKASVRRHESTTIILVLRDSFACQQVRIIKNNTVDQDPKFEVVLTFEVDSYPDTVSAGADPKRLRGFDLAVSIDSSSFSSSAHP